MTNTYEIKTASRKAVRPLVGIFAESGCGKTYSSLLLARGFVGPHGKIALKQIEKYGSGGICPYGCDTPHIAAEAISMLAAVRKS